MKIPVRSKGFNLMKFLPKPTSFAITNPPFSPGSIDKRSENTQAKIWAHSCKNISYPVKLIPAEARHKSKITKFEEPTSPKVSCMGQIKHKKKLCKSTRRCSPPQQVKKAPSFSMCKMFRRTVTPSRPSEMEIDTVNLPVPVAPTPSLCQLKRLTCRRENTLVDFDWKAKPAAVNPIVREDCHMNEGCGVSHSEPKLFCGGGAVKPEKVNLWTRRIMEPPRILEFN